MKLGQNVKKMVHLRSKARSLGQILLKPYVRSRGHIFGPILMKSRMSSKMGHVGSKTRSLGQIFKKKLVYALEASCLVQYS